MNIPFMRSLLPVLVCLAAAGGAQAATFVYDMTVIRSQDAIVDRGFGPENIFDLPDLGTTGTMTIDLAIDASNAGDPVPFFGDDVSALLTLSTMFGNLTSDLDAVAGGIEVSGGLIRFANGSSSNLAFDLIGAGVAGTLAGSYAVSSASFDALVPTTLGDLLAILSAPDAFAHFTFNGTAGDEFVALVAQSMPPTVPLPAGALLLMTGLGGLVLTRRRRD